VRGVDDGHPLRVPPERLRAVTETWMRTSRAVLERFVDPTTARGVDALVEGLVMHTTLSTAPLPRDEIRSIVAHAVHRFAG
jgi:TetR/AcrR family transcriptional regulator, regulator of biofilm formation and stress response